jgi:antitoxin CptB
MLTCADFRRNAGLCKDADIARPPLYITHARPRPGYWHLEAQVTTRSSDGLDERRRRLLFRSWHRGIREVDLVMGRFADSCLAGLTDAELDEYERLLEVTTPDLLAWVMGEREPTPEHATALFRRLRDFHLNAKKSG